MTLREDARTRILLYFLLGIALPSGLLGYLAFRGIQNDRALVEREERIALEAMAARIDSAADALLAAAARAVSEAPHADLSRIVGEWPVVHAVFTVQPGGEVRIVAADGLVFHGGSPTEAFPEDETYGALLRSARRLELRSGELESALAAYQRVLGEAPGPLTRARALGGVARVQRKLSRWDEAGESYERLRTELGDVPAVEGVPPGAAASLELAGILLETGDTARARSVLLELHQDLVEGRWRLTPARFDLLRGGVDELLAPLARGGPAGPSPPLLGELAGRAREERARALALLAFQEEARGLAGEGYADRPRFTVEAGGRTLPVVMLSPPAHPGGATRGGFIVDPEALSTAAVGRASGGDPAGLAWELRDRTGTVLQASAVAPAPGSRPHPLSPAGFSPWVLDLYPAASAGGGSFLTSRRAVYLYAFLLLAGILVFGLTLTIRSVGHELELARMKSDFVSTVSHEFKSPLTAIRQLAEMLRADRVPSEERRRQYYDVLLEQSERLSRLVDNVLDFARMEAGGHELSTERVDLEALVEDTVAEARRRVAHEGFTIRTEVHRPLPPARMDGDAVRQALDNLIDNGVKYSGASREVVVRGFREDGQVVLAVRDFGIGIDPDETRRIFERFYRVGDELTRSVKGTGLGLTLVKQIVEAHGGSMDVQSSAGEGSTFSMRFPLDPTDASPSIVPQEERP